MKTAKEMFEEAKYELIYDDDFKITYRYENPFNNIWVITFSRKSQTYMVQLKCKGERLYTSGMVHKEVHKAINKQVEELGWLND